MTATKVPFPDAPEDDTRSATAWFWQGVRDAASGPMFIVGLSNISVGGLARDAGFSMAIAVGSTFLMWAGPGQVIFFGALASHASLLAVAIAVSLSSVRFLPMCVALLPLLRGKATRGSTMLFAAHFTAMTVWIESMRRNGIIPREKRLPWYFGFSACCIFATAVTTAAGFYLVGELPLPLAAGLLFATPIYFVASLIRNARLPIDWLALVFGFAIAPVAGKIIGGGLDLLVVGVGGGTAAYVVQRALSARANSAKVADFRDENSLQILIRRRFLSFGRARPNDKKLR